MEEKKDKYTHTQKPNHARELDAEVRKDNYGWGSFKLAADSRVRRKTTRLDDDLSKNGWESGREKKSITEVAAVAICQTFFLENVI